ncbi:MAG: CheR family methyltransferase [bacterium]
MRDSECTEFLRWCLPGLGLRWEGFRKVRGQVCKRLGRRIGELGLRDLDEYRRYVEDYPGEWPVLDSLSRVTISRFYRDRGVFDTMRTDILPALARGVISRGEPELRSWSAGCGSGEEPYTLQIIWKLGVSPVLQTSIPLSMKATDIDPLLLERARKGMYLKSSLRDLPRELREQAFVHSGEFFMIKEPLRENIAFIRQDIREEMPEGPFHLILCRNLVFTYFDEPLQEKIIDRMMKRLIAGGILIIGIHETLPRQSGMVPWKEHSCIYRKPGT